MALNPPVPQPQFTYRPSTGVLPMIGERSGVTSTMPPQLRSMRSRVNIGNSSQIASSVWAVMCSPPVWLYDTYWSVPAPITSSPLSDWLM